jgi:phage terminase large subunit
MYKPFALDAEFPEKLQCLFQPKRTKVFWGGRGAGRSWGVARWLLLMATERTIRVLCCRELQNSITESVHKLLSDQIEALGLAPFYEIQANKIIGKNGTTFSFEGIKNNTSKIKSYEGIDYCWVEEANKVSRASWGTLIPTIRKPNSEIIMTFNPELETDYTYQRFVLNADADTSFVVKMTWRDNPWFPEVLKKEMELEKKRDYDAYLNVWEGHCLQMLEGAVYAKQLRRATVENRICDVPYEKETPVDTYWDVGRADYTTIWFVQQVAMQYRILAYYEDHLQDDVSYYLRECQTRGYVYGTMWLPHDAKAKRLGTKRSIEEQVRAAGYRVGIVPKLSLTDGINAARIVFPRCWFDKEETADGIAGLRRYRYRIVDGQLSKEPMHNDTADSFRYFAVASGTGKTGTTSGIAGKLAAARSRAAEVAQRLTGTYGGSAGQGWMK